MSKNDSVDDIGGCFIVCVLMLAVLLVLGLFVSGGIMLWGNVTGQSCHERWSGYNTQYSIFGGCRVEIDGTYIPEDWVYYQNGEFTIRVRNE